MKRSKTISVKTAVRKTRKVRLVLAIACSVVLLALNLPATIHADDGDLDPGFGEAAKSPPLSMEQPILQPLSYSAHTGQKPRDQSLRQPVRIRFIETEDSLYTHFLQ